MQLGSGLSLIGMMFHTAFWILLNHEYLWVAPACVMAELIARHCCRDCLAAILERQDLPLQALDLRQCDFSAEEMSQLRAAESAPALQTVQHLHLSYYACWGVRTTDEHMTVDLIDVEPEEWDAAHRNLTQVSMATHYPFRGITAASILGCRLGAHVATKNGIVSRAQILAWMPAVVWICYALLNLH
jgi:hypothetical protein